jgi:membrane protease YdiL (CAAX protease family)
MHRKQLTVFFAMLLVYALCAFLSYAFFMDQLAAASGMQVPATTISPIVLGLANAGIILVAYGLLGLAGYGFARKLGLPGIYSVDGNWRRWVWIPMGLGVACGVIVIIGDLLFAPINGFGPFAHPAFPSSLIASLSAGIGEEILFRVFVFGLWGFLLNWILSRWHGRTAALWIANVFAALLFAAGHLPSVFLMTHATSLAEINPIFLVEIFLLNGILGLIAGWRYMKDGLVAASGVHLWADIVWHVLWGLLPK